MIQWSSPSIPNPPYVASIFHYFLSDDLEGYAHYDAVTLDLVKTMPGFLGYESFKHDGRGSFISYWTDMEAVREWGRHPIHKDAKVLGMTRWYRYYHSVLAEVSSFRSHTIDPTASSS